MRYIIMCGGDYKSEGWDTPRQLVKINGEPIVQRTIRLLRECGVSLADIAISSNNVEFSKFGVPLLYHSNNYSTSDSNTYWCDAFYPTDNPACYICGDVVFSPAAIRTIVETETSSIEFFASAPPFDKLYSKKWAEPFALKVQNQNQLHSAISLLKIYDRQGLFARRPIMWELWQVVKHTPLNQVKYNNYTVINDYTCDVDEPKDVVVFERILK